MFYAYDIKHTADDICSCNQKTYKYKEFWGKKLPISGTIALYYIVLKKGPTNLGRSPLPIFGQCRKENIIFLEVFPSACIFAQKAPVLLQKWARLNNWAHLWKFWFYWRKRPRQDQSQHCRRSEGGCNLDDLQISASLSWSLFHW